LRAFSRRQTIPNWLNSAQVAYQIFSCDAKDMLDEYRQRFRDFTITLSQTEYWLAIGHEQGPSQESIYREHSDLFSGENIAELRRRRNEINEHRETAREEIRRLIAFAIRGYLVLAVREISNEITRSRSQARIDWKDQQVGLDPAVKIREILALTVNPADRRELWARYADLLRAEQDLQAERISRWQSASRELGYDNYLALCQDAVQVDYQLLAAEMSVFQTLTENDYADAFGEFCRSEGQIAREEAIAADLPLFERMERFDRFFANGNLNTIYHTLFADLGFRPGQQENLTLDFTPQARKRYRAACFAIRIPEEIKLVLNPAGNSTDYPRLLATAARAQHFAWTSETLRDELRVPGDGGLAAGWAALFASLFAEPSWLVETFGFVENREFRRLLAITELMRVRCDAAQLCYETELFGDRLAGTAAPRYVELLSDGVRVQYDQAGHLVTESLAAADRLRGRALAMQMREHLKTRYGHAWWRARKAGEMISDIWNTGHRYRVEELASIIGLGSLDYDWLSAEMREACQK
jgi:hypothetical protein